MSSKGMMVLIAALIAIVVLLNTIYWVDEREKDIVFKFGEIVRYNDPPGLHAKIPLINQVKYYDARIQTMDAEPELFLTLEKKNLKVDSFVKWRIKDVFRYYTSVAGSKSRAQIRLSQLVNDGLRAEIGKRTVENVVSGDRAKIMDSVRQSTDKSAREYGIEVVDVRLKRVDYDRDISESVYRRMEAEREKVAKELRARGEAEAKRIRAEADAKKEVMLAKAYRKSEEIRGKGDGQATTIYGKAFSADEDFFNFYRSLNAYKSSFKDKRDLLILEPDSDFFKFFQTPGSSAFQAPAGGAFQGPNGN